MIGALVTDIKYTKMASEAARRFTKHTGLNCITVLSKAEGPHLFREKLALMLFTQQTTVLFDADLWFIRDCDLSEFDDKEAMFGVLDPGRYVKHTAPYKDCMKHNMDVDRYFNSGFVISNMRHKHIFEHAYNMFDDRAIRVEDFGEQSYLNMATQHVHQTFVDLDCAYNYAPIAEHYKMVPKLKQPYCIHAMGYSREHKEEALAYYMTKYNSDMILT